MAKRVTEMEVAEKTGIPVHSLRKWRSESKREGMRIGPPCEKIMGRVYYRIHEVEKWAKKQAFLNAS